VTVVRLQRLGVGLGAEPHHRTLTVVGALRVGDRECDGARCPLD
jgi:hypothetical protein